MADPAQKRQTWLGRVHWTSFEPALTVGSTLGLTTVGDILSHNGTNPVRVAKSGTNGFVLTENSAQPSGNHFAAITGFDTRANGHLWAQGSRTAAQSIAHNTATAVTYTTTSGETLSPATRSGKYLCMYGGQYAATTGTTLLTLAINGVDQTPGAGKNNVNALITVSGAMYVTVTAGQTIVLNAFQTSGAPLNLNEAWLNWVYIGKT